MKNFSDVISRLVSTFSKQLEEECKIAQYSVEIAVAIDQMTLQNIDWQVDDFGQFADVSEAIVRLIPSDFLCFAPKFIIFGLKNHTAYKFNEGYDTFLYLLSSKDLKELVLDMDNDQLCSFLDGAEALLREFERRDELSFILNISELGNLYTQLKHATC